MDPKKITKEGFEVFNVKGIKKEKMKRFGERCFEKCEFLEVCSQKNFKTKDNILIKISSKTCGTISGVYLIYEPVHIIKKRRF